MNNHARRAGWPVCLLVGLGLTAAAQDRTRVEDRPNQPTAAGAGERRTQSVGAPPARLPEGTRVLRDLEYVPGGHERQKLDLYLPKNAMALPLVVWVHGGAWRAGSKERCPAVPLLREGYAVASLNYRLSQHAVFPAQIEDCKAAIRWLRAHAKEYGIDSDHVGVWGSSAGGHLVAMLGTTGDVKDFEKGENLNVSSRVQAVCDWFGPTDFTQMNKFQSRIDHDAADSPESLLMGGPIQTNKGKTARANPMTYVSRDDPPFLIVHGDADPLVPFNQSELLQGALRQAGVAVQIHLIKGAGHGGPGFNTPEVQAMVRDFFARQLKSAKP